MKILFILLTFLISCGLIFLGYFCVFNPSKVRNHYLGILNIEKNTALVNLLNKNWMLISFRICGIAMMFLAIVFIYAALKNIFNN